MLAGAQEMEGAIRYLVVHDRAKKMAAVDYISQQQRERISYMWGKDSEWKQYTNLYFSPTESKYEDSEERAEPDDEGYSWRKEPFFVTRNFEKNTMYDLIQVQGKSYQIQDSMFRQDWKIRNDLKEVAGHLCMNASWEDSLKKQQVTAWFALDMPLSAGPEMFCGLPGLILEVDINNGAMVITADRIDLKKLAGNEMTLPKKVKGKKISNTEFRAIIKKHMDEQRKAEQPYFWSMRY